MALEDENKQLTQRLYDEVFTGGNADLIDELLTADFVEHEATPGYSPDREGTKQFFNDMRSAFPDIKATVEDLIASGDQVVARLRMSATHRGDFMGVPATNKPVDVPLIDILRFQDGKIAEHWGVMDQFAMMQQLGVIPEQQ